MSETYLNLTIPEYGDPADGPLAFKDLVDSMESWGNGLYRRADTLISWGHISGVPVATTGNPGIVQLANAVGSSTTLAATQALAQSLSDAIAQRTIRNATETFQRIVINRGGRTTALTLASNSGQNNGDHAHLDFVSDVGGRPAKIVGIRGDSSQQAGIRFYTWWNELLSTMILYPNGDIHVGKPIQVTSDETVKVGIQKVLGDAVEVFRGLDAIEFSYETDEADRRRVGLSAQAVDKAFSEAGLRSPVHTDKTSGKLSIDLMEFLAYLTKAVGDLAKTVEAKA